MGKMIESGFSPPILSFKYFQSIFWELGHSLGPIAFFNTLLKVSFLYLSLLLSFWCCLLLKKNNFLIALTFFLDLGYFFKNVGEKCVMNLTIIFITGSLFWAGHALFQWHLQYFHLEWNLFIYLSNLFAAYLAMGLL